MIASLTTFTGASLPTIAPTPNRRREIGANLDELAEDGAAALVVTLPPAIEDTPLLSAYEEFPTVRSIHHGHGSVFP